MEVILVLNGPVGIVAGFEHNPPPVHTNKWNHDGFSIEFEWTVECEPKVLLKDAYHVDQSTVKEIENTKG